MTTDLSWPPSPERDRLPEARPRRAAPGLPRWWRTAVGATGLAVLVVLVLHLGAGFDGRELLFAVVATGAAALVLVVFRRAEMAARPVPWHPDDFVLHVRIDSGEVLYLGGIGPVPDGLRRRGTRVIQDVLLFPAVGEPGALERLPTSPYPMPATWSVAAGEVRLTETLLRRDGDVLVVISRDVTEERAERDRLARCAATDPLTGLGNRVGLEHRLATAVARSARSGRPWAVLTVDLDGFKECNDRFGHAVGDQALAQVAAALRGVARGDDDVLRVGGDEIVLVVRDLDGPGAVDVVAQRVLAAVRGSGRYGLTASVGVALGGGTSDPAPLTLAADAAMYEAKRAGGDTYRVAGLAADDAPAVAP